MDTPQTAPEFSPTQRVVETVASYTDADPLELPPLHRVIDSEALDTIVTDLGGGEVCFQYAEVFVTIQSDGTVDVGDRPDATASGGVRENGV